MHLSIPASSLVGLNILLTDESTPENMGSSRSTRHGTGWSPVSPFKKVERDIADPPVPVVNKVEEDAKISVTKEKTRLPDSALKFTPPLQVKPAVKIWDLPAPPGTEDISFKTVISEPPKFWNRMNVYRQ